MLLAFLNIADGIFEDEARALGTPERAIAAAVVAAQSTRVVLALSDGELTALRRRVHRRVRANDARHEIRALHRAPSLKQAFDEALQKAVRDGCSELTAVDVLSALVRESTLETIAAVTSGGSPEGRPDATGAAVLNLGVAARDLTALAMQGRLTPVVGRRTEIKTLARHLQRTTKRNVLLIGEPGVGKTAVVEGFAQVAANPQAPEFLRNLRVVQVEVGDLIAGTKHRGDMEARMRTLVDAITSDPNLVLFLDEVHLVMQAGAGGGALDVANILKPALARSDVRCIGATTTDEFERHIKADGAFLRRFQLLRVGEFLHSLNRHVCW